jgi:hypothetical protein
MVDSTANTPVRLDCWFVEMSRCFKWQTRAYLCNWHHVHCRCHLPSKLVSLTRLYLLRSLHMANSTCYLGWKLALLTDVACTLFNTMHEREPKRNLRVAAMPRYADFS